MRVPRGVYAFLFFKQGLPNLPKGEGLETAN